MDINLKDLLANLNSLQDALDEHAIVSITDVAGRITYVNDRFCHVSQYSREELLGQNHRILKSDAHNADFYKSLWKTISRGNTWHGVIQNRRKDGKPYWVQSTIVPILNEKHQPDKYISVRTDVSQREQVRQAVVSIFDCNANDVVGKNVNILMPEYYQQKHDDYLKRYRETGKANIIGIGRELEAMRRDGSVFPMELSVSEMWIGEQRKFTGVIREIIDRIFKSDKHDANFYKSLWETISRRNTWYGVIQNRRKDGKSYWVQSTIVPNLNEKHQPNKYISVRTDVTQREQMRQAMEQLATATAGEESYDTIARAISIGLDCRWAGFGRLVNRGDKVEMLGYWCDGVVGDNISYTIENTPCADVCTQGQSKLVADNVVEQYPRDTILAEMGAVSYHGEPVLDEDGSVMGVLFAIDDKPCEEDEAELALLQLAAKRIMLEIKRADFEQVLQDNELQLAEAQRMAQLGSWTLNYKTDQLHWSDEVYRIFEIEKSHFGASYETFLNAIHPNDRERVNQTYQKSIEDKTGYSIVHRLQMKDGRIKWVLDQRRTIYDAEGNPLRSIGYVHDITERKLIEKELKESEQRFEVGQRFSNIGTFEWHIQNNQIYWSNQVWSLLGLAPNSIEPSYESYIERVHPDDRERLQDTVMQCIQSGSDIDIEYRLIWPDNSIHWICGRGGIERDDDNQLVRILGIIMDIDSQKQAEEAQQKLQLQLQQAQKMESIGQLTGGIAHDFNNILSAINGFSELCLELCETEPQGKLGEYLSEILQAGERGRELVQQMLAFGRATSDADRKPVDAASLIKEVIKLLSSTVPSSIDLTENVADGVPKVMGDAVQLHQVITNLMINARDAVGAHGHIELGLRGAAIYECVCSSCAQRFSGEFIELNVRDDGPGIPSDVLAQIFEPFFTTKQVGKGSGMGLSMVHGIIHQCEGHILVESELNVGTSFRLLLPPAIGEVLDNLFVEKETKFHQVATDKSIMVVDDEESVSGFLSTFLNNRGYQVNVFNDPVDALASFKSNPTAFDLVITDQTMPNLTGDELAHELLMLRPDLPVILCTGYSEEVNESIAHQKGISVFLYKPFSVGRILDCVATLMNGSKVTVSDI